MDRRWTAGVAVAAVAAVVAGLANAETAQAAAGCQVQYAVSSQWPGGFGASVTITNLGDSVNGWRLSWSFAAGQTITDLWNGTLSQAGAEVTVANANWNAALATGGTAGFGFNGTWNGTNPAPASFSLNGTVCNNGITTTTTTTTGASSTTTTTTPGTTTTTPGTTTTTPGTTTTTPTTTTTTTPTTTTTTTMPSTTTTTISPGSNTTAWRAGRWQLDAAGVVRRSNVVLRRPNGAWNQSMPLGNGNLGAAVWAAGGFTAQLNRNDTFPDRKSPGQVVIPGLSRLTSASDFTGSVDLYDGTLRESGGGMTLTAYVRADTDQLVVDVTGADPNSSQTAQVKLWNGRNPRAEASGSVAALSETWVDNNQLGATNRTFGSLAGISAGGRNVRASAPDSRTAQVSFQPNSDGSFRVITVAPTWTGGNALTTATSLLGSDLTRSSADLASAHLSWWHTYWGSVGLIKITSSDGSGEYAENLRTLYLYFSAASNRGSMPGTQAGLASLFNPSQDSQPWYPAGYWFWNLRMFVQANLSAGAFALNTPVFNLYRSNLSNIQSWTNTFFPGHQGICVPETMRFNGNGYYNPGWEEGNASCSSRVDSFNAKTVTSGAEISLWIWQTYLATDDRAFLADNYPIIRDSAKFLLSHATTGSDGLLHTRSNAHEQQWNVSDPVTDVSAMRALFPAARSAAQALGVDADLVSSLGAAIPKLRGFPTTGSSGSDVIAVSAEPNAAMHNQENDGLEPVWPYNLIGDSGGQSDLAKRTFARRPYPTQPDWSFDPLQAARLGLRDDFKNTLSTQVNKYQLYPSGLADWNGGGNTPYLEQIGVSAAAVTEALVQDYDGTLRITPAWPTSWDVDGVVAIQHLGRAFVQIRKGQLLTVAVQAGATGSITVRNPWPGQSVQVVDGSGATVLDNQTGSTLTLPAQAGTGYLIQRASAPTTSLPFDPVGGSPATAPKSWSGRTIGIS